jgi:hypothetical protein
MATTDTPADISWRALVNDVAAANRIVEARYATHRGILSEIAQGVCIVQHTDVQVSTPVTPRSAAVPGVVKKPA